ncbi:hypothetical protein KEM55_003818, partial [Ascosphaera atra]
MIDGIPCARLAENDWDQLIQYVSGTAPADELERNIWKLCKVLFQDNLKDEISNGVPEELLHEFMPRIRKDRVSELWEQIVRENWSAGLETLRTAEERAFAYLSCHRVEEACRELVESRNFRLATLVAQIGHDEVSREEMKSQIASWRNNNVWSEMTEPIRAIYELLAGNCLRSEGKAKGSVEDRSSSFFMSERFGLDWMRAFGLRLWYGTSDSDPVEKAIEMFYRDIAEGGEPAYPLSSNPSGVVSNPQSLALDSPLWVLMKVYARIASADKEVIPTVQLPAEVRPEAVSGSSLNSR